MSADNRPFSPLGTVSLSASTNTNSAALSTPPSGLGGFSVRIRNPSVTAFLAFGDSTITAAVATGMPMSSGTIETFFCGPGVTHIAVITASGSGTLALTTGTGG